MTARRWLAAVLAIAFGLRLLELLDRLEAEAREAWTARGRRGT